MEALLEVRDVSVVRGHRAVLRRVSLSVANGEVVALIGPNGSGKTTLLEAIVGARRPDRGSIRGRGRVLDTIAARGPLMAWVADEAAPTPERSVERLLRDAAPDSTLLVELLEPLRLRRLLRSRCGRLSRGERHRVALAEALLLERPLVVLDEPFAAFDPLQMRDVIALIRRLAAAGTSFVVSIHQLEQAVRVADRSVLLNEGRVLAEGTEDALRQRVGQPTASLEAVVIALLEHAGAGDAA